MPGAVDKKDPLRISKYFQHTLRSNILQNWPLMASHRLSWSLIASHGLMPSHGLSWPHGLMASWPHGFMTSIQWPAASSPVCSASNAGNASSSDSNASRRGIMSKEANRQRYLGWRNAAKRDKFHSDYPGVCPHTVGSATEISRHYPVKRNTAHIRGCMKLCGCPHCAPYVR